jgi:hypothetical protein
MRSRTFDTQRLIWLQKSRLFPYAEVFIPAGDQIEHNIYNGSDVFSLFSERLIPLSFGFMCMPIA